jgi:hypothetical protein
LEVKMTIDEKTSFPRLRRFNLSMGILHLVQGVLMIVLSNDSTRPIYTSFLTFDLEDFALVPDPHVWIDLRFGPAVAIFLLLSAVAHFYLSTIGFKRYVANLEEGRNPIRFYEYALSSSVMIVVIALLVGIYELSALIALFGVNAAMNLFGISMENENQYTQKTNWASFIYGCVAGIVPWIVITWYFLASVTGGEQGPPGFVYAIVPTLFVFFNIFALNMVLQYKKVGPWKNYLFGERMYIVLSLSAKTVLAWIIFSGTLAPV